MPQIEYGAPVRISSIDGKAVDGGGYERKVAPAAPARSRTVPGPGTWPAWVGPERVPVVEVEEHLVLHNEATAWCARTELAAARADWDLPPMRVKWFAKATPQLLAGRRAAGLPTATFELPGGVSGFFARDDPGVLWVELANGRYEVGAIAHEAAHAVAHKDRRFAHLSPEDEERFAGEYERMAVKHAFGNGLRG